MKFGEFCLCSGEKNKKIREITNKEKVERKKDRTNYKLYSIGNKNKQCRPCLQPALTSSSWVIIPSVNRGQNRRGVCKLQANSKKQKTTLCVCKDFRFKLNLCAKYVVAAHNWLAYLGIMAGNGRKSWLIKVFHLVCLISDWDLILVESSDYSSRLTSSKRWQESKKSLLWAKKKYPP